VDGVVRRHRRYQVTIVGLIQKIAPQSTFVNYTLDDGTGTIDVRQWIDTDESQFQTDERAEIVPNRYVRVVAYPRVFNGERSLVSMQIIPIRDFNEVTFHGLEVIATHLAATKTAVRPSHPVIVSTMISNVLY
jgi:replication factor A2